MNTKVLVIDDDFDTGKMIEILLKPLGFQVLVACSGTDGLKIAYTTHPDLVILDVMLPGIDGFEVCSRLRELSSLPILMLTARTNDKDVLHGFNVGVNDYLRKPFSKTEFEARVCALLRHSSSRPVSEKSYITSYSDGILEIDLSSKTVKIEGRHIDLSTKEFDLLACLVREQGATVSHRQLLREVWGESSFNNPSESSLYVYYLRKKLRDGEFGHQYIRTHWGRGYWFEPRDDHKGF